MVNLGLPLKAGHVQPEHTSLIPERNCMTQKVATFITDETEGRSTFVQTEIIEGRVIDIQDVRGNNPLRSGRNEGRIPVYCVIKFDNLTELRQEDGTTPNVSEWSVRYPYSILDEAADKAAPPERGSDWFKYVAPAWLEFGVNLGDRDTILKVCKLKPTVRIELKAFDREYEVQQRVDGVRQWDREPDPDIPGDRGIPIMIRATARIQLPVKVDGLDFDPQMAHDRAAELWEESEGDVEVFRSTAIKDDFISQKPALRRKIQADKYDPEKDRNA
jgi:hypothetical protein